MQTTRAWGQRPSGLGLCAPEDDLAYMVAWDNAERTMVAWERQLAEEEIDRGRPKNRA